MAETVWEFSTARFQITLKIERDYCYRYDGDDEDGETQAKLDSGEYIAFDSSVVVYCDGREVGRDFLGGSVYEADDYSKFWTEHRGPDPMNRNCTLYRAVRGENCVICHYFPDMVREAISAARKTLCATPKLRCA